ncbi:MAG TPA: recombination protein RecR [Legionellales bacterium]|nr:recombination protein RecR [Legionellales bacterium]
MDVIDQLTESLRCLPGVGPKTAQRLVYYFLKNHRKQALTLAKNLTEAMQSVQQCQECNNFSVQAICKICQETSRNRKLLCIIEQPTDLIAIEQSQTFKGYYFVLTGKISPLDGISGQDIGLDKLQSYLEKYPVEELIIALSPSIETQATIHSISQLIKNPQFKITQLAQGIPMGSELQFLDPLTIANAIRHRNPLDN